MFSIVTDSCSSLSVHEVEDMGVIVCPLTVMFGTESYLDGYELTPEEFYKKMKEYAPQGLPKTACPSPGAFAEAYGKALAGDVEGVICLPLAQGVSGGYNSACVAAAEVEGRIEVINVRDTTVIQAVLIETAVKMRDAGATLDETVERLNAIADVSRSFYAFDTVENLVKGRLMDGAEEMTGSALKIKPMIYLDDERGGIVACGKERTTKNLLAREVELVEAFIAERPDVAYEVRFGHGNGADRADKLKATLAERGVSVSDHEHGWIGSVIGTYCGDKAVVTAVYPKDLV